MPAIVAVGCGPGWVGANGFVYHLYPAGWVLLKTIGSGLGNDPATSRLRCDRVGVAVALRRVENVHPHTQIKTRLTPDSPEIPLTSLPPAAVSDPPNEARRVACEVRDATCPLPGMPGNPDLENRSDARQPSSEARLRTPIGCSRYAHLWIPKTGTPAFGAPLLKIGSKALAAVCLALGLSVSPAALAGNDTQPGKAVSEVPLFESVEGLRTIPVITNRMKQKRQPLASRFGGGRGPVRHGSCSVSRTRIPGLQPLADTVSFHVPQSIDIVETVEEIETEAFWRGLAAAAGDKRPTLYVHGYRVGFAKACRRAARLHDNLGLAGRLAIFSWPSDGTALGYAKDEANVIWSIPDLHRTIERMADTFGAGGFNVIAHSLGARGVIGALMRAQSEDDTPLLNRLILIAPDVDAGIFVQNADQVTARARTTSLYVSKRDAPLALSREVHGYPRLGEKGPHLKDLDGVETIDVSDLDLSTPTGHLYHLFNNAVIDSLRKRVEGD